MSGRSIIEYFSEHEGYRCGYCGCADTNCSHGMWAHSMTVKDYQALIDRGWRRSGCYVYKPTMKQTCCPQYTIKCNALEFRPSRSQKRVIKKVNKFLSTGVRPGPKEADCQDMETQIKETLPDGDRMKVSNVDGNIDTSRLSSQQQPVIDKEAASKGGTSDMNKSAESDTETKKAKTDCDNTEYSKQKKSPRPGQGIDPNKPKCVKAKLRRKQAWQEKHPQAQLKKTSNQEGKSLEDHLNEVGPNPAHKLELRVVRSHPPDGEFEESFSESHSVYTAYQMCVHGDPPDKPSVKQYTRFLCKSPLKVQLCRRNEPESRNFEMRFIESFKVYKEYQMAIHKDKPEECDQKGYTRFLVDSPLKAESRAGGFPQGFGSFHQQYLLDGKIIAVGVVDILPTCISSVYLYYDPDYSFLSLGVYSALREVAFTRHLQTMEPDLKFYYMGFYIHSCPKMRYKGGYSPSFLVCPETYDWFPIEECTPKLDVSKYSRFAPPNQDDPDLPVDLSQLLVLWQQQAMPYVMYRLMSGAAEEGEEGGDEGVVKEYGELVGNRLAARMLLYRK